jgi:hypothetical protein
MRVCVCDYVINCFSIMYMPRVNSLNISKRVTLAQTKKKKKKKKKGFKLYPIIFGLVV